MNVPENFRDKQVCVLGLGYVGLTLATVMADVGFKVAGIEIRDDVLRKLESGEPHFHEPGLAERLRRVISRGNLTVHKHIPPGWEGSLFIITVGTPLDAEGHSRMDMIANVSKEVAEHMKPGAMVIMRSTVKLGTTRNTVLPILARRNVEFDLAFCPERTLEGRALVELRQLPQIVGGATLAASIRASQVFQFVTPTVVKVSDPETAEMIKLIDNAQRDVQFAYANEVARACDAFGISAVEVIRAGKLGYPRTNLPLPGPVGGPCLEKDSHILAEGLAGMGMIPEITLAARTLNEKQPEAVVSWLADLVGGWPAFPKKPVISLLGLAFKGQPETDDLRGTMAKPVLHALQRHFPGAELRAYDAVVAPADVEAFGAIPSRGLAEALSGCHLALILNNHPVFAAMAIEELAGRMAGPALIYDFWNTFVAADLHLPPHAGYVALGSHAKGVFPAEAVRG